MKKLRDIIPLNELNLKEDREEHMKKHGDKACAYAEKIKKCCEEFCKVAGKYDDYELKSLARELEDIYERLDNNVSSKKEMKKHQDVMKSSPTVYENIEQIDELSRDTLKSYVKKGVDSFDKIENNTQRFVRNQRRADYRGANGKYWDKLADKSDRKYNTRAKFLKKAVDKIAYNEDVEQINELSRKTLKSYLDKRHPYKSGDYKKKPHPNAVRAGDRLDNQYVSKIGEKGKPETRKYYLRDYNTRKRMTPAENVWKSKKTVKEDVEQVDELSNNTLNSYIDKLSNKIKILHTHSAINNRNKSYALADANDKRAEKYKNNLKKAKAKLKEDVEDLSELSKEKLAQYSSGALKQMVTDKYMAKHSSGKDKENYIKHAVKRKLGIDKAYKKSIVKEEQIDELSKNTLMNYHGLAKARMRLSGPKDANIRINGKPLPRSRTADRTAGINLAGKKLGKIFNAEKVAKKEAQKIARRKTKPVNEGKFSELDIIRQEKAAKEKAKLRIQLKKKMGKRIVN